MHARNPFGAPDRVIERVDPATVAREIKARVSQCDALIGKLAEAGYIATSLHLSTAGEPGEWIKDARNLIDDATTQTMAARKSLLARITNAMEDA
jgi:hypothetical protein